MSRVDDRFHPFQADAWIFDIMAHPVGVTFEIFNGEFGACRAKREIILEKIVVPVDMRDREHLQCQAVVTHQVGN